MHRLALAAAGLSLLAACRGAVPAVPPGESGEASSAGSPASTASPTLSAPPAADAVASSASADARGGGGARTVSESNDLYQFSYSYPAAAGAIPAVRALLEAGLAKSRAQLIAQARQDRAEANRNRYPYHAHSSGTDWKVVTDLPGWLSLSAQITAYTGGAHGMSGFDTLLWDKRAAMRREPLDLFTSRTAFRAAVKVPFCASLDRERARKRGPGYAPAADELFGKCIDPVDEATVILGSTDGQRFDRVGFLIAPYAAGPYVEGSYDLTLPVSAELLRAVKPEYRRSFAPAPESAARISR